VAEIVRGVSEFMYWGDRLYETTFLVREESLGDIAFGRLLKNPPRQSGRLDMLERR